MRRVYCGTRADWADWLGYWRDRLTPEWVWDLRWRINEWRNPDSIPSIEDVQASLANYETPFQRLKKSMTPEEYENFHREMEKLEEGGRILGPKYWSGVPPWQRIPD